MADKAGIASVLRKAYVRIGSVIEALVGVLMVLMVALVFSNVIARYFLNASIAWTEEVSRFFFIWIVFLGATMAFGNNEHLGVDLLIKAVPRKASMAIIIVADVLVLAGIWLLASGGWTLTAETFDSGWTSPATETPYGLIYMIVPICAVLLMIEGIIKIAGNIRSFALEMKGAS